MKKFDYEVAVIGGGSAGYAAARMTANAGLSTVVIEGARKLGGLCILRGCMPTKALLYAAEVKHLAEHAATWGIRVPKVGIDFTKVMARKDIMVKDFADYRGEQLTHGKFKLIRAHARFIDKHTLALSNDETITARKFIITTGSKVAPAPVALLDELGYLTSDTALELKKLPKSLIVLGGGAVAVEFAQIFARLGVKVTLIQRSKNILSDFDTDAAEALEKVFEREGIRVVTGIKPLGGGKKNGLKEILLEQDSKKIRIKAEEILFALGRVPNTASLGLSAIGVKTEDLGIVANKEMQTSVDNIYTAGDCTGPYEIVHIAVMQGEVAAHNIIYPSKPRRMDYRLITSLVFTDPQIATVGLTEKTAKERKIPYIVASYPFADHGKSLIMDAKDGFVKLLADPKTGEIIGGACVGPVGGELIHIIVAAMNKRMAARELATMPHYHPTLAEIWTYPAEELADKISAQSSRGTKKRKKN